MSEDRMTAWPEDGGYLPIEDLAEPVVAAIHAAYRLERKDRRRNIPWVGPELIDISVLACCPPIAERLQARNLSYAEEDQGREAIEEIVLAAIQLGIEQGKRLARSKEDRLLDEVKGVTFTVSVGWNDRTSVHTQSGRLADPVACLSKGIQALVDELARVQRCPRHRAICRDSDGSGEAGETGTGSTVGDSAGPKDIAQNQSQPTDSSSEPQS